jgi:hypothetical protein
MAQQSSKTIAGQHPFLSTQVQNLDIMKTTKTTTALISNLFTQKWKKQREARNQFLLTPKECVAKVRIYNIRDIVSAIFFLGAAFCIIALLFSEFVLDGSMIRSLVFGATAAILGIIGYLVKPEKIGELTYRMYFDWLEVLRGLHRHGMLLEDISNKSYFAEQAEDRLRDLVRQIKYAQQREEFRKKAKLKNELSNLYWIVSQLDLELPEYEELFSEDFTVRCATSACNTFKDSSGAIPRSV